MEKIFKPLVEWQNTVVPKKERTVAKLGGGLLEETQELVVELLNFDGSEKAKDEIAGEAVDVIFRAVGVVKEMKPNVPIDVLVKSKMDHTLNVKYPIERINQYVAQGMTHEQAMKKRKQEFIN